MMMRCLEFAGIKPCKHPAREAAMNRRITEDYSPNPHGWYEPLATHYRQFGFTATIPDGRSVKIPLLHLPVLAAVPTTVIWMHRDPKEIRASYTRTFPDEKFDEQYRNWPAYLKNLSAGVKDIMQDRKSVQLFDVQYAEAIADPMKALAHLPIDVHAAARGVDPSLYRNRAA